jgi:hypothetical protein
MKTRYVLAVAVLAVVAGGSLAAAGPASQSRGTSQKVSGVPQLPYYHPRLFVLPAESFASTTPIPSSTAIGFQRDLGTTAKLVLFAPKVTAIRLDQTFGTRLGTAGLRIDVAKTTIAFDHNASSIVAADPATYGRDKRAQACAPGRHAAVWLVWAKATKIYARRKTPKLTITLPIYVDRITPSRANMFSAYRLQVCFGSPKTKQVTPGWPAGAVVRRMTLSLAQEVITEQATVPGTYFWRGVFTSYGASGRPAPSGAVESRAILLLPVELALTGRYDPARQAIDVNGSLTEGGQPVVKQDLVIWYGTALGPNQTWGTWPGIADPKTMKATTDARGQFSQSVPAAQTTYLRASLSTLSMAYVDRTGCGRPSLAPKGCVTATKMGFTAGSSIVEVVVPR